MGAPASTFAQGLIASGPAREYAQQLMLYGQFIGDWHTRTTAYLADGSQEHTEWDVRFSWVLEGRAVQDLWITPPARDGRGTAWHDSGNRYSTTLRIYDPSLDAWHIVWINPPSGTILRQLGRKVGHEIVQDGDSDCEGRMTRWVYRDIKPETFRWCNERSSDAGQTWTLLQEMRAYRV